MKPHFVLGILAAILVGPAASQTIGGPQGRFDSMIGRLEWSSRCPKPYFSLYDDDDTTANITYSAYRRCLIDQATRDIAYARDVIAQSSAEELRRVRADAVANGYRFE